MTAKEIRTADMRLLESVDSAMEDAVSRSGDWVVCRLGCTDCCRGSFEITSLDVLRLREGMHLLAQQDSSRAEGVQRRVAAWPAAEAAEDLGCPVLDPETGACELYEWRPVTCRTFGAATRTLEGGAVGHCELCYAGIAAEDVARCAVTVDPDGIEADLLAKLDSLGVSGTNSVADALRRD